jgi:riboflavin kinase/FMN adenylyltransferase
MQNAIGLGLFDGVHIGHREVILQALAYKEKGLGAGIFTFDTETVVKKQGRNISWLYSKAQKQKIMQNLGIDIVYAVDFCTVCFLSAEDFAQDILQKQLNAKVVLCGCDFKFGRFAASGVEELRMLGEKHGFSVQIVDEVICEGLKVSSDSIRRLLEDGEIEYANRLLGEKYTLHAEVVHGLEMGRTIGFPTVNQKFGINQVKPRFGVYASQTRIDGKPFQSITNIGIKPTVTAENIVGAETHILDFDGDLYGKVIDVKLTSYLRREEKFGSLEKLKAQIRADIHECKNRAIMTRK